MSNKIALTINGEGVSPETVPIADLIHILSQFSTALKATAESQGTLPRNINISLVDIRDGSDELTLHTDAKTHKHAQRIVDSLSSGDASGLPAKARNSLQNLWSRLNSRKWDVEVSRNGKSTAATIRHDKPLFGSTTTAGTTSVVAYIIRAGGDDPTVAIKLQTGERLTAAVESRDLAQSLGKLLYKNVELIGEAMWATADFKMLTFRVTEIGKYVQEQSDPAATLETLSRLSGGLWDEIDPDEYLSDMRSN